MHAGHRNDAAGKWVHIAHRKQYNFATAKAYCESLHARLLQPTTRAEIVFVIDHLNFRNNFWLNAWVNDDLDKQ